MKILHTEASTGWGGQEIRILSESIGLRERGHEIVFVTSKNAILAKKAKEHNFTVYEINFRRNYWIKTFFHLKKIFKKEKIDLLVTHSSLDAWIAGITARWMKIPIVRMRHLSAKVKKGLNSKIVYNYLADRIVTTCHKITKVLSEQSKKDIRNFISIPTGIDPKKMEVDSDKIAQFRKSFSISSQDILIATVCFMRSWKGIEEFLSAASLMRDKKCLKWMVIGGGHIDTYKEKAKKMKVDDIVIFTGHISIPYAAISAIDIFVLLSTANEGVSQASLQAGFFSKPLITTATGGLCEVCIEGISGFIVPTFSPCSVVQAINSLYKDPQLRYTLGKNAHRLVMENFTYNKMLDRVLQVYQDLV